MRIFTLIAAFFCSIPVVAAIADPAPGNWFFTPGLGKGRIDDAKASAQSVLTSGIGITTGMSGNGATYLTGNAIRAGGFYTVMGSGTWDRSPEGTFLEYGGLQHVVPVQDWRGRRIALTVRIKNENGARGYVSAWLDKRNNTSIRTLAQVNKPNDLWQSHTLVLDVPDNAVALFVYSGLTGAGKVWVDGLTVQDVGKDLPASWNERIDNISVAQDYPPGRVLPAPGPVRKDQD